MTRMAEKLGRKKYVRTHPRALLALKRLVIELAGSGRLTFEGQPVTEEAFVCASWLWMESMGTDAVAEGIRPHLARLDALVAGDGEKDGDATPAPAAPAATINPATGARLRRRRGRETG